MIEFVTHFDAEINKKSNASEIKQNKRKRNLQNQAIIKTNQQFVF